MAWQTAEVAPIIAAHWERASFPFELIPKLRKLGLGQLLSRHATPLSSGV